jgi:hypothetical protein
MSGFSVGVDHFGLATADLQLIESNNTPLPQTRETATDEDDNFVDEDQYDGAAAEAVECLYELQSSTLNLNTLLLGHITNGGDELCAENITVTTSNGEWPKIRVAGYKDVTDFANWKDVVLPSITISGKKQAQLLDFTVGATCKLTSSQLAASAELSFTRDSAGDVSAMGFSGGEVTISGEAVEITGAVTWTPATTYIETQPPGANSTNITWATGTFEAAKGIVPTT